MSSGLEVVALSVSLGGHPVLDRIDLVVAPHESVALLGPSGAGKSTLLRAVAGLVAPDAGTIRWDGEDLATTPAHRRRIGLVFQDAVLFPHRDVAGNVAYGLEAVGAPSAGRAARVEELLALVDLEGFEARQIDSLSGGQAQRVALARALAPRPRLLLLDEPFGALDRDLRDRLGADVRDLLRAQGIPALHVTHDEAEALLVADRVLRLVPSVDGARVTGA